MIDAAARSPAARLRVRALRLLAERRMGRPLSRVEAVERIERHGRVDAALDALIAEERAARVTTQPAPPVRTQVREQSEVSPLARVETARRDRDIRDARLPLALAAIALLAVAAAALARVGAAAAAHHGARSSFLLGIVALAAAAAAGSGIRWTRWGSPSRARGAGVAVLSLIAAAASLIPRLENCALASPLGLEAILNGPSLPVLLAAAGCFAAASILGTLQRRRQDSSTYH